MSHAVFQGIWIIKQLCVVYLRLQFKHPMFYQTPPGGSWLSVPEHDNPQGQEGPSSVLPIELSWQQVCPVSLLSNMAATSNLKCGPGFLILLFILKMSRVGSGFCFEQSSSSTNQSRISLQTLRLELKMDWWLQWHTPKGQTPVPEA